MQKKLIRKGLVLSVIVLFIGVGVSSGTNIKIQSSETLQKELINKSQVEISMQFCRYDGADNYTVFLTQQQNDELETLIDNFKADLDNVETSDETIEIYNDMVISLDELGILPDDMTIEEAQQFVTTGFNKVGSTKNKAIQSLLGEDENVFCLTSARTSMTNTRGPLLNLIAKLFKILYAIMPIELLTLMVVYMAINPIPIGYTIGMGARCMVQPFEYENIPATGWVFTIGSNDAVTWNGSFYGQIPDPKLIADPCEYCPAVSGFTGIKIVYFDMLSFCFGASLRVKIGDSYSTGVLNI